MNVFMATSVLAQLHVVAEPSLAESLRRVAAMEFLHANVTRILVQVNFCLIVNFSIKRQVLIPGAFKNILFNDCKGFLVRIRNLLIIKIYFCSTKKLVI